MDYLEAIRLKAMLEVMEEGFLYHYRRVCRWYSQKFYTPLPEVEALPEEQVLQTFFETQFEEMSKSARRKLALEMTETDEESRERKAKESASSDDDFLKKVEKEEKRNVQKLAKKAKKVIEKVAQLANEEMARPKKDSKPKPPPPPEISLKFDDEGNLSDEESIPLPPPRKR